LAAVLYESQTFKTTLGAARENDDNYKWSAMLASSEYESSCDIVAEQTERESNLARSRSGCFIQYQMTTCMEEKKAAVTYRGSGSCASRYGIRHLLGPSCGGAQDRYLHSYKREAQMEVFSSCTVSLR
jgi:hypothetical protein